jgi:hypothetical protein
MSKVTIDDVFEVYNQITGAARDTDWEPMLTKEEIAADIARNLDEMAIVENPLDPHYYIIERCVTKAGSITQEDMDRVHTEIRNLTSDLDYTYIYSPMTSFIPDEEDDVTDWFDEYFLTYAPQQNSCPSNPTECEKKEKCEKKCECGATKCGSPKHAYYCPLYKENQ